MMSCKWFTKAVAAAIMLTFAGVATYGSEALAASTTTYNMLSGVTCNDGSTPVYYLRQNNSNTQWLFYLEGGGECSDNASCTARFKADHQDITSTNWSIGPQGILSTSPVINPTFHNFNVVEVHYCSSDYWSGYKTGSVIPAGCTVTAANPTETCDPDNWSFQGREIAVAAMKDLVNRTSVTNFGKATEILLAGSSAGGIGISITVHDLLHLLPASAMKRLLAVDAGFSLEIQPFDPTNRPTYEASGPTGVDAIVGQGITYWHGHGDTPCWKATEESYASNPSTIACYDTANLLSGGTIPFASLIAENELDGAQLADENFPLGEPDPAGSTYLNEFADCMAVTLDASIAVNSSNSVYAPQNEYEPNSTTTGLHELFTTSLVYTAPQSFYGSTPMLTPQQALTNFYMTPTLATSSFGNGAGYAHPPAQVPAGCPGTVAN